MVHNGMTKTLHIRTVQCYSFIIPLTRSSSRLGFDTNTSPRAKESYPAIRARAIARLARTVAASSAVIGQALYQSTLVANPYATPG